MLKGRIININSTKYVVDCGNSLYNCTLRGIFRKNKVTPLVGDYVDINEDTLQVCKVYDRYNYLTRPNIANVDYALIMTSVKKPDLDLYLLDKLLLNVLYNNIAPIICFSKVDLLSESELKKFKQIKKYYSDSGYIVVDNTEIDKFKKIVSKKAVVTCGQTGAGKSTFINKIDDSLLLATDEISESLGRGKHTTRYVSLYKEDDFFIADTPGFSSLDLNIDSKDISSLFLEFQNYECKYRDCNHINTSGCQIQNNEKILKSRYDNYVKIVNEVNDANSNKFFKK